MVSDPDHDSPDPASPASDAPAASPAPAVVTPRRASAITLWDARVSDRVGLGWPHPRWFTKPLGLVSITGNYGVVWFVLAAIGALSGGGTTLDRAHRFAYVGGAVLVCQGVTFFVKAIFKRPRPLEVDVDAEHHIALPRSPSFPSSHASMSVTGAVTLSLLYPAWWVAFAALALVLAFSRVYLRVHYLLDVLAGLVLGSVFVTLFVWLAPPP
jgi:undecaprenyl-diphosphatase